MSRREGSVSYGTNRRNFRMDAELKESVEEICRKMGMSLTMAFTDSVKEAAKAGNRMQKAGELRMRIALS